MSVNWHRLLRDSKYIKYKLKYLKLKNHPIKKQYGGDKP